VLCIAVAVVFIVANMKLMISPAKIAACAAVQESVITIGKPVFMRVAIHVIDVIHGLGW